MKFKLTTPVLFLVFNRLGTVKRTFQEIRKAKPQRLFVSADGPRNPEEKKKTDTVREYILQNIDWKCKVKTLFHEKNLGCKMAVSSGIDWYFENVKQGIILEDDCLPSQSFFRYCQELLEKYKDDKRIMQISGTNVEGVSNISDDYFFTINFNVWGWATWRRAWKYYDVKIKAWPKFREEGWMRNFSKNKFYEIDNIRGMNRLYDGKLDTWDYQWWFACATNNGLCIIPKYNQITNLGFVTGGTHMSGSDKNKILRNYDMHFPLKENTFVMNQRRYQESSLKFFYRGRIRKKILKILKFK